MREQTVRQVFLEVGLQDDYLSAEGAVPCQEAPEVVGHAKRLVAFARWARVPVISCVDRRYEPPTDPMSLAIRTAPPVPLRGAKLACTLLPSRAVIESDNCLNVSLDIFARCQQVVFTKVSRDPFNHPKLDRLLTELPVRRYIVFGVPLEATVRMLVLGLILRKRNVTLIRDACGTFDAEEADMALRQLEVKGAEIVTTEKFLHSRVLQRKGLWRTRRRPRSVA